MIFPFYSITPAHQSQANHLFCPPVTILGTRYRTVLFPKLADAFLMMYQTAAVGLFTNIGGVWRILPRKSGIYRACPIERKKKKKSPQPPNFRRLWAPWSMAGAEGFEPSARGFGGNVEIYLALRLLPDFRNLLPAAPLVIQELMLFWWYELISVRPERSKFTPH